MTKPAEGQGDLLGGQSAQPVTGRRARRAAKAQEIVVAAPKEKKPKGQHVAKAGKPTQQAVAVRQEPAPQNVYQLLSNLMRDPTVPTERVQAFMAMKEREDAKEAERLFGIALGKAQAEMPKIPRDKTNTHTGKKYPSLEKVLTICVPIAQSHGFSFSYDTEDSALANHYRIVCYCRHEAGHTQKYTMDLPADTEGQKGGQSKSKIHGIGSTKTYGRRYIFVDIFNLIIEGQDDDGNKASGYDKISEEQIAQIADLAIAVGIAPAKMLKGLGIRKLEDLSAKRFEEAIQRLNDYAKANPQGKTDDKKTKAEGCNLCDDPECDGNHPG